MPRSVLITGCSSGFGRASAALFLEQGWHVAATMRDVSEWKEDSSPKELLLLSLDVSDRRSIEKAFAEAISLFGSLDCVVNNAGRGLFSVFESTPLDVTRSVFETNLFGYMSVMQCALPYFRKAGKGRFVNVSSGSGIMPEPLMSIYSASKHAVEGFTESVAYELSTQNVTVKLIEPGLVKDTNFMQQTQKSSEEVPQQPEYKAYVDRILGMYTSRPSEGLGTEQEVAEAILRAATDDSDTLRTQIGSDTKMTAHMRWETNEGEYRSYAHSIFDQH